MPRRKKKNRYDPFKDENPGNISRIGSNKNPVKNANLQNIEEKIQSGLIEGGSISAQSSDDLNQYKRRTKILGAPFTESSLGNIMENVFGLAESMGIDVADISTISGGINMIKQKLESRNKNVAGGIGDLPGLPGIGDLSGIGGIGDLSGIGSEFIDQFVPNWAGYIPDPNDAVTVYLNKILGESVEEKDMDGDGDIDAADLAISRSIGSLEKQVKRIHPMLLKMQNDKNFHHRVIKERNLIKQKKSGITNQVSNIEQGLARFDKELNRFNVRF